MLYIYIYIYISVAILAQGSWRVHFACILSLFVFYMDPQFESVAGALGKLWRQNRRKLPSGIRNVFAQLLLEVRLEYLPAEFLDTQSQIGRARFDVRGISELLKNIACRQAPQTQKPPRKHSEVKQQCGDHHASASLGTSAMALVGPWATAPEKAAVVCNRGPDVTALKRDITELREQLSRMTADRDAEVSSIR